MTEVLKTRTGFFSTSPPLNNHCSDTSYPIPLRSGTPEIHKKQLYFFSIENH